MQHGEGRVREPGLGTAELPPPPTLCNKSLLWPPRAPVNTALQKGAAHTERTQGGRRRFVK